MSHDRQDSRRNWSRAAEAWGANAERMRRATMPVSAWMVDAIGPQPGDTLLELAAGAGDTGFLAAELIRPGGTLICSDLVPEMLNVAQERARALGIDNVRFRQIDAQSPIDIEAARIDGVLCRWGYMLMPDPVAALQETRRVLRPGGRLALAVWAGPDDNLWSAIPARELVRRGVLEPPDPDEPGPFAWAAEGVIADRLEAAGFVEHEIGTVGFENRFESVRDWWESMRALSMRTSAAAQALDEAAVEEVLAAMAEAAAPFTAADGSLAIPARTWTALATA